MQNDQPQNQPPVPPAIDQPPTAAPAGPAQLPVANQPTPERPAEPPKLVVTTGPGMTHSRLVVMSVLAGLLLLTIIGTFWQLGQQNTSTKLAAPNTITQTQSQTSTTSHTPKTSTLPGLQLDPNKNYGDKYASGLLPVGDGKYSSTTAKQGYIYTCSTYARNLANGGGGASARGPWFTSTTTYDINKKAHVQGTVSWRNSFTNTVANGSRTITTNDLPSHTTGVFPVAPSDPAYAYDRNPNSISAQNLSYILNANPAYGSPNCMGGQAGVMLSGVAIFNGFDAGGRDAGAWEVQDGCGGHPEKTGEYHYHTLSSCITGTSVGSVIGFALDGFPITGPRVGPNNILTTSDLDECHGITSEILLDGKKVTTYHYVMTQDFPYSVSCFRSQAIQPPGLQSQPTGPRP